MKSKGAVFILIVAVVIALSFAAEPTMWEKISGRIISEEKAEECFYGHYGSNYHITQIELVEDGNDKYWYIGYICYNSAVQRDVLGGAGVDAYTGEVESFSEEQ